MDESADGREDAPTVMQVAIKTDDGIIHTLPRPARHGDIINCLWRLYRAPDGRSPSDFGEQGFLLTDGTFAGRKLAWVIADESGQILPTARERTIPHLFTEDVW